MVDFIPRKLKLEDYWRGIVLLGRNVASYKFALANSLLELRPISGQLVTLDELAPVFSKHICEHLKFADKQGTSSSSRFLNSCRKHNEGEVSQERLSSDTVKLGFENVITAFHVVGTGDIPTRFFTDERKQKSGKGIKITDEFSLLLESDQARNFPKEVEARWSLVEAAWELGMSRSLVAVQHDAEDNLLYSVDSRHRRKAVTSSRDALNGYQKGECFYCFDKVSIDDVSILPDVDHFFPHLLKQFDFGDIIDGVWNLVLACKDCNRGVNGKFEKLPKLNLFKRLHRRNEFLISSHHPLRETLMLQTGKTERVRSAFLTSFYDNAHQVLVQTWEPEPKGPPSF